MPAGPALRWKDWGEKTAVAKGKFYGVKAVDPTGHHADAQDVQVPGQGQALEDPRAARAATTTRSCARSGCAHRTRRSAKQAKVPGVAAACAVASSRQLARVVAQRALVARQVRRERRRGRGPRLALSAGVDQGEGEEGADGVVELVRGLIELGAQ